jgi:hypothetical protein
MAGFDLEMIPYVKTINKYALIFGLVQNIR